MDPSRQHAHASSSTVPLVTPVAQLAYVFSEYSTATGNAMSTKINAQARAHESLGGRTYVIVSDRRRHDYGDGTLVRYASSRSTRREWFTDLERRVDAVCGATLGRRPLVARFHREALDAVPADAEALVVYNYAGAVTDRLVRRFGGKVVLHLGNDVFRSWRASEIRRVIARTHVTVAVSDHLVATIVDRIGHRPENLHVLRNGVDSETFRPVPAVPGAPVTILSVGNVTPHKGVHHLIAAAEVLARRTRDFRVHVVGSAGLRPADGLSAYERELRRAAAPLGDLVRFTPFVDRRALPAVYGAADVFAMPVEWQEPAGQVVTEAMASGLAVVSARSGGIPEYLGPDGVYVDPRDTVHFADALHALVTSPTERVARGQALRTRAESMTWERNFAELMHLLAD
ncbi:glycosyltransferase family 4 protein [Terracoccus sp. 273MFTsu3.1]|uniref:glycosyltransferase family 4 protein n=1 Tax=Terracoccus sp. 273MFTsu3.1 TaxID=1172188 RepID=UPI000369ABE7|nr:glycosyltransferase family 4 protein [Terracoccus sp. 273MFTsu3.1]